MLAMAATYDIPRHINMKVDQKKSEVVFIAWTEATARTFSRRPRIGLRTLEQAQSLRFAPVEQRRG